MAKKISLALSGTEAVRLPPYYRYALIFLEIVAVIFLALICSNIVIQLLNPDVEIDLSAPLPTTSLSEKQKARQTDYSYLKTVDAFFGLPKNIITTRSDDIPESTLDIQVFGLRAKGNGDGTVILKSQGSVQKLAKIGDQVANGTTLAAIYPDRIDIRRNGRLETIYLNKDRENARQIAQSQIAAPSSTPQSSNNSKQKIEDFIALMDLKPFREGKNIAGFTVGDKAEPSLLILAGLEKGDIISSVNGNELLSWERVKEISEGASGGTLNIQLERDGEMRTLELSQSALGL
ncbi:MAG: PDZ domain-containing protein [Alphaproteobacteria bacterium]|nr:PDZ domain-containing protein [Alphaproteobacteria bacterium]HPF46804.1 type II secretion system protein N [Emcibacteraceae bacterium]